MKWTDVFEYIVYAIVLPILALTSIRLARKKKLHGNMRFIVSLMTLSVFWMLFVRIVNLATMDLKNNALISTICYYSMQTGYNWYRGSFFAFIIERFVASMTASRYENLNSFRLKMYFALLTLIIILIVMSLLVFADLEGKEFGEFFNTFAFIWMFSMQSSTLPMTGYVLYRTRNEWQHRHDGASLSQRFQIADTRASAKLFVPLTASNFLCVLFLLGNLAAVAFGGLANDQAAICWMLLDWLDFYQRLFYIGCIVRTEGDCLNYVSQLLSQLTKRKTDGRRMTISVTPLQTKTDTDEYFKSYKTMWG